MAHFPTTTWSTLHRLHQSREEDVRAALAELCTVYWLPLYSYVRRSQPRPEDAMDLVQGYFVHLLDSRILQRADPSKGLFRSFLIASLKNFIANQGRAARAQKRAPAEGFVSLDAETAEHRYLELATEHLTPEEEFERNWALVLIEKSIERLREEQQRAENQEIFDAVQAHVLSAGERPPYRQVAEALGLSEAAIKVRVSRLRKRLGQILHEEIRETVGTDGDVEAEVRHLLSLWDSSAFRRRS